MLFYTNVFYTHTVAKTGAATTQTNTITLQSNNAKLN